MNIEFSYLYRDAGNYKQHHTEIFTNNTRIPLGDIRARIKSSLIDGERFYADRWMLKDLHFDSWDNKLDHTWHEFEDVRETHDEPTKGDIIEFLVLITLVKTTY